MDSKSKNNKEKNRLSLDSLRDNELIGGICAALVVLFVCIRIFVLETSADGVFDNLIQLTGTVLSLVVLMSAVRIMLSTKKTKSFQATLIEGCEEIDKRYGALIVEKTGGKVNLVNGMTYVIADNVDTIFTAKREEWDTIHYMDKFAFGPNFLQTGRIFYYVNYANMGERAHRLGEDPATTARLLARDIGIAIQRNFSDIVTAHAQEISQEEDRAVVTIFVNSKKTEEDAERILELINYLLFLHFVAT